ncbi:MAG: TatD family hydrolase [Bacilli bacterium]|nr:TatD family hydrolase [Bacilli bacterium]MDD4795149.1 TatD family hydrolase [Bacilli bacterium]
MFTDTHCHILSEEYSNYEDIIQNLNKHNIKRIIINGYNLSSNKEVLKLINRYSNVYGAIGLHPNYIEENNEVVINHIKANINNQKIIAIGEIGLDYYRNNNNKEKQLEVFNTLLTIADENKLPVIIHNRESTEDLIKILKKHNLKGIIHSFSGSYETALELIKLGFKLGINGIITFKNTNLGNTLKRIDLKNILIETDSPYLAPEPVRGSKNEPRNLIYIANKIAKIYNINLEELSIILENNFADVFDI